MVNCDSEIRLESILSVFILVVPAVDVRVVLMVECPLPSYVVDRTLRACL